MIKLYYTSPKFSYKLIETYPNRWTLEDVLDDVRKKWEEECKDGSQLFVIMNGRRNLLAMVNRHPERNDLAITTYADGKQVMHKCECIYDENGNYINTLIVPMNLG